jgi:CBS domain-containing protein
VLLARVVYERAVQNLTARDVMTLGVQNADADWTLDELRSFLVGRSISGAPVCDAAGKLVGVVSSTDLMRSASEASTTSERSPSRHDHFYAFGLERPLSGEELRGLHVEIGSSTKVREIMTPLVFEVAPDAPLSAVADMMVRGRIHRVFVSRAGKIEGVVSALDLVRVLRDITAP